MMSKMPALFYLIVTLFSGSCNSQSSSDESGRFLTAVVDTLKSDIPTYSDSSPVWYVISKRQIESILKFENLEKGFNGINFRFWYSPSGSSSVDLVTMSKVNEKFSAQLYRLNYVYNLKGDSIISINKQVYPKNPISGWENFLNKLYALQVLSLPDFQKIPNYTLNTDEGGITVEISMPGKYRIYHYPTPLYRMETIPEAKKMEQIFVTLEQELKFKRIDQ
jgi:hypothetical protein